MNSSNNMKDKWDAIRVIINRKRKTNNYCPIGSKVLGDHYSSIASKLNKKLVNITQDDIPGTSAMGEESWNNTSSLNFNFRHITQK